MIKAVLVVEDETLVRMMAVEILEGEGFRVIEASTADDAVTLLEAHPDIGVIFSDIEMPGKLNGLDLAHLAKERWPDKGILLVSGRTVPKKMPFGVEFIGKPYSIDTLVDRVRTMSAA